VSYRSATLIYNGIYIRLIVPLAFKPVHDSCAAGPVASPSQSFYCLLTVEKVWISGRLTVLSTTAKLVSNLYCAFDLECTGSYFWLRRLGLIRLLIAKISEIVVAESSGLIEIYFRPTLVQASCHDNENVRFYIER